MADRERERANLRLFGGPALWRSSGEPVPLTQTQARLLTLIWGHEPRGLPRASAIWLLWEEEDTPRTRQRLRQLLHEIRTRAGFRPVAGEGDEHLAPRTELVTCDADEYKIALADHHLRKALALHDRGFASRLERRGLTEEYEDWLLARRETLRRRLKDAGAAAWDHFRPAGAWTGARDAAEVLVTLDPGNEAAVMKLAEARAMTGSPEGAEALVADFVGAMPVGFTLAPESTELLERLRRLAPLTSNLAHTAPPPPPLVGRRHGLAIARRMLARVAEGSFEFLLLRGEGGSGKTRIMEEVWKEASLAGMRCLQARPVEMERRIPLNPLLDMLRDPFLLRHVTELGEPWRAVIASLLPTLPEGMDPPVVPPVAEASLSRRLYDAFATLFAAAAADEPLLLFIDDLQWADATTVAVLQFVQRRWRTGALGIVAALRPEMIAQSDALAAYLNEASDLPVTTVELGDLNDDEARTLIDLVAATRLDPLVTNRLCALAGRNPFYLIELTRDHVAGRIQLPEMPTDAITLPISLRQLLEPKIAGLGEAAADAGAYLSVWGRWITLPELAALTGTTLEESAGHAEELERCRLAEVDRGRIRLAHELFRSAMYQGLTATRRAMLHGKVATFLEGIEGQQPGELAVHYDRAGNAAGAAARAREAADRAMESGAMAEAAYFLQLVVENVADARLKALATADLARVLHMSREILRANPLLELAASRLRAVGEHGRALRMDIRKVEGLAEVGAAPLSDLLDRLATIKSLASGSKDDEALALALDAQLHLLHRSGMVPAIRSLFEEVRPLTQSPDPVAACLANASLALNVLFGDAEEALRCAREAVRVAEGENVQRHRFLTHSRLVLVLVCRGMLYLPEGRAAIAYAGQLAESSGDLTLKAYLELNQGVFSMEAGALEVAGEHFDRMEKLLGRSIPGLPHINLYHNRGELLFADGQFADARDAFLRAYRLCSTNTPDYLAKLASAGVGLTSLEMGDLSTARDHESSTSMDMSDLYFDPTIILDFRRRLHLKRGDPASALAEVERAADLLRSRLPLPWIKLVAMSTTLRRRMRVPPSPALDEAIDLATNLRLSARVADLARMKVR
jgi:DNA-binding SARP family transcriptional activator